MPFVLRVRAAAAARRHTVHIACDHDRIVLPLSLPWSSPLQVVMNGRLLFAAAPHEYHLCKNDFVARHPVQIWFV
jgi:hypothetical protein